MHALDTMLALASKGEVIALKAGDVLFSTGDTGSTMYGLLEGAVRLTWVGEGGTQGHEDIPTGHVFGAGALVMEIISTGYGDRDLGLSPHRNEPREVSVAVQEAPMFLSAGIH